MEIFSFPGFKTVRGGSVSVNLYEVRLRKDTPKKKRNWIKVFGLGV